jgi:hypothetical protein
MIGKKLFMISGKAGFSIRKSRENHDCRLQGIMIGNFWNVISSPECQTILLVKEECCH